MNDTVFQGVLEPISKKLMGECTRRFCSDYHCEGFMTFEHLQTMIYVHLNEIKSLRALEVAINSQNIGIKSPVKRSTLSDANQRRPAACFLWILEKLLSYMPRKLKKDINKVVRVLDSSPIQLRGRGYDEWTKEYATSRCQGHKLHVEYDLQIEAPRKIAITHPPYNDVSQGKDWPIVSDTVYVFDKGYYDFNGWWSIHQRGAFFVTRLKKNVGIVMQKDEAVSQETIVGDGTFIFKHANPRGGKKNQYTESLRRISVARGGKSPLILVTNLHELDAETIAELYKARWEIELFFKWIKQNLKLKKFLGKSANAVKIQLITAIIAYVLVVIYKEKSADPRRLSLVLVWLRHNLHIGKTTFKDDRPPIDEWFCCIN